MNYQRLLVWVVSFFVVSFSMAAAGASQSPTATSSDTSEDGEPEKGQTYVEKARMVANNATERAAGVIDLSAERKRVAATGHRVRNTEFAFGYHLAADDVASDYVAGGFNIAAASFHGTQLAMGFNFTGGSFRGGQIAPVFNTTGSDLTGVQFGGAFNTGGGALTGLQLAGGWNSNRGPVTGVQLAGGLNVATGDVRGVQLAAFNIATGPVEGVQLGVFNAAPSAEVGIGLINIYWDGVLEAEVYGSDEDLMMVGIRHGGKRVYNVYHIGTRRTDQPEMPVAYGMGLGWRTGLGGSAEFSLDVTGTSILGGTRDWSFRDQVNLIKLRPMFSLKVADALALFGGPSATLMVNARPADADDYARLKTWQLATVDDGADVAIWPGFTFGGRFF